jgi:hypothetical protein
MDERVFRLFYICEMTSYMSSATAGGSKNTAPVIRNFFLLLCRESRKARVHGGVRIFVGVSYVAMLTIVHTSKSTYRLMTLLRNL